MWQTWFVAFLYFVISMLFNGEMFSSQKKLTTGFFQIPVPLIVLLIAFSTNSRQN